MKKLFTGLFCAVMALAGTVSVMTLAEPVPVMAEGLSVDTTVDVDVTVTYTEEALSGSTELGSGETITLQDGTKVTVQAQDSADGDIRAAVVPVTQEDAEAFAYVTETMKEYGGKPYAFYLLFYRDGKEIRPSSPVTVTVTAPDGYREAALYSFAGDSAVQKASDAAGGVWTFAAADSRYFAAVQPKEDETEPEETEPVTKPEETEPATTTESEETEPATTTEPEETEPVTTTETEDGTEPTTKPAAGTDGNKPSSGSGTGQTTGNGTTQSGAAKTGDETQTAVWLLLLAASGGALAGICFKKKRSRA
ncbi:hypothetical protein [Marvinbryantia formatexigens]|nr:hypothetical protein [Marvinbryantia formatexigens]UWO24280.1 hypothetical protein NQ534_17925 [Marvinbryantia formatexigens DSM 14469]SDF56265.1 hypothetical protein SAMN05660368_00924 [Marvinbryantia formatexigens]